MGVPPKVQPMLVTLKTLGYTAPMGVPPKVQVMLVTSN